MKLIPKVISLCVLVALIVVGSLGYFVYLSIKADRIKTIEQGMNSDVALIVSQLDQDQKKFAEISQIIARNRQVKKALSLFENRGISQELNDLIEVYPFINYILVAELDGTVFSSSTRDGNKLKVNGEELLLKNVKQHPLYIIPKNNKVSVSTIGKDHYLSIIGIANDRNNAITQWYTVNIIKRGQIIGELIISIDWRLTVNQQLDQAINKLSTSKTSIIAALINANDNKIVIARYRDNPPKASSHVENFWFQLNNDELSANKLFSVGASQFTTVLLYNRHIEMHVIQTLSMQILGGTITCILLMIFLLYLLLGKALLERLNKLHRFTNTIADGKLEHHLTDLGSDEVGDLGRNFNNMVKALSQNMTSIDKLHQESELRRIALDDLEEKSRELAFVIDSTASGIWDWKIATKTIVVNERWAEIAGYTLAELPNITPDDLADYYYPEDIVHLQKNLSEHLHGKTSRYSCESRMKHKQGHWVWVFDSGKVVEWDETGKPSRMIGTHQDITVRKNNETMLMKATRQAEQAAVAKSEFLASMSHEIRTPMNGVLGMLGLLVDSELNEEQQHRLNIAMGSAKSLLNLINDILDFSKIDAGKIELENIDFNLRNMLGEISEAMGLQLQVKNLELILDVTKVEQSMVKGDPSRLRQIISNIISNATKFTSQGEVVIQADLQRQNEKEWQFHCRISDTGIGIPENKLSSLFDSFSQVDSSTTRKYGGTGLGLSIVKKLCKLMGGDIKVTSTLGEGSCFHFTIILQTSNQSQQVLPEVDISHLSLLIVDDNITNNAVLKKQLEHWGASVNAVHSGQDALLLCEQEYTSQQQAPFDIAFIEMQMSDMDGASLGKQLKANKNFAAIKLIMMSRMSHLGDARHFADLGFNGYFPKPATTADLFGALAVVADDGETLAAAEPLVTSHYLKNLAPIDHEPLKKEALASIKDTRILLVDDNRINQMVAQGILNEHGFHNIEIANDGVECLATLSATTSDELYQLILMDCQMPELDGYKATQQIRAGNADVLNISIPIIAMTANAMADDKQKCLDAGMNDYIAKPIEPEILIAKLVDWLSDQQQAAS